jgi:hypothetical protein
MTGTLLEYDLPWERKRFLPKKRKFGIQNRVEIFLLTRKIGACLGDLNLRAAVKREYSDLLIFFSA